MIYPPRYATLDHWRGLAALLVVFHHAVFAYPDWSPEWSRSHGSPLIAVAERGWVGVPIFFAISGYCIAATADSSRTKWTGWAAFAYRRARRIFPPYWATLLLLCGLWLIPAARDAFYACKFSVASPKALSPAQWAGNVGLFELLRARLAGDASLYLDGPAWSLGYEEQYYTLVGLILFAARRWLFVGVAVLTAVFAAGQASGLPLGGTAADMYWYGFASGFAAFAACTRLGRLGRWLTAAGLAGVSVACAMQLPLEELYGHFSLASNGGAIGAAFAALLVVLRPLDGWLARRLVLRPLRWCGDRCYSIYLVHWPLCALTGAAVHRLGFRGESGVLFATIPACLIVSVAAGAAFHWAVERHFLNRRPARATSPQKQQPAPEAVSVSGGAE